MMNNEFNFTLEKTSTEQCVIGSSCLLDKCVLVKILDIKDNLATVVPVNFLNDGKWDEDRSWEVPVGRLSRMDHY